MENRFLKPGGFEFKEFVTPDGIMHRYGFIVPENAKGVIVLLHGFSEFIEKYFETIHDLSAAGYAVYTFDWRGQGKSQRWFTDNLEQVYHDGFDKDAQNLHYFMDVVIDKQNLPVYALAHSMGGHIVMKTIRRYPNLFQAVALSAPMFQFRLPMPKFLARGVLWLVRKLKLQRHAVGGGDWSYKKPSIECDPRSRDPDRRLIHYQWCEQDEGLRLGNISFEWVYHALQSITETDRKGYLESIQTPVFIGMAQEDSIVDNRATRRALMRLPNAAGHEFHGSQHEILMERDHIRNEFLAKTLAFFDKNR